jgi:hypothetical protein
MLIKIEFSLLSPGFILVGLDLNLMIQYYRPIFFNTIDRYFLIAIAICTKNEFFLQIFGILCDCFK